MASETPDLQLFRIAPGNVVHSAGGKADSGRFVSDVQYLTHFAVGIAECLSARCIEHVAVEDATSQTAFYYIPSQDRKGTLVNGILTQSMRPPEELLDCLYEE
jgi:hypothetical protein